MLLFVAGVQVRYAASLDGAAGLPRWLNLLQTGDTSAFIYGTPEQEDLKGSITLHVSVSIKKYGVYLHHFSAC